MIDVIFPLHREDRFLVEAIDSLYASKSVNIRLIVVDDRTNKQKDLNKVFTKFKNYEYIISQGGVGYGECLKLASNHLTSEFTALMNSDDTIHRERLIRQTKMLDNSEISITKMNRINENSRIIKPMLGDISGSNYNSAFLILGAYGANATWCMHRDWWLTNAFFDNEQCLDWRIALQSFPASKIAYTNEPLYNYRKHRNQVTSKRKIPQKELEPLFRLWASYLRFFMGKEISREVFDLVAVPWNITPYKIDQNYIMFRNSVLLKIKEHCPEIYFDFNKLIMRRDINTITKNGSPVTKIRLMSKSYKECVPIGKDLLTNFIKYRIL
jgi:glycosyltransferase involved in cell wall biosynthesis